MLHPSSDQWSEIPGSDTLGCDLGDDEEDFGRALQERLRDVLAVLGPRWVERPLLSFQPAPTPSSGKGLGQFAAGHGRRWSGRGPAPCFRLEHTDATVVKETFRSNGLLQTFEKSDFVVQWSPGLRDVYHALGDYQRMNHFPGSTELTRKDRLWSHFTEMTQKHGSEAFDFVPETYVLPEQLDQFLECHRRTSCLWIVKPHASSQGKGIFVLRDIADLPLEEVSVVSRYVDKPLLIQGLKFDLRIYVLVTSYEPLRAYVYREGLTRFASQPYSTKEEHIHDAFRHLTNYSINKSASNFVENQEVQADNVGHKWSLSALNKHLRCVGVDIQLMWVRIMDLIVKTLLSVEPAIAAKTRQNVSSPQNCFELYGFDVLVDEALKPWLLEVNLSPSMQAESPLDWKIKTSLLSDAFNLVGIPASRFLPSQGGRYAQGSWRPLSQQRGGSKAAEATPADTSPARLVLDRLTEEQLKMVAGVLQESRRCQNFVRLHPTRFTIDRYAPITGQQQNDSWKIHGYRRMGASQLLAAVLFGPAPLRSLSSLGRKSPAPPPVAVLDLAPAAALLPEEGGEPSDSSAGAGSKETGVKAAAAPVAFAEGDSGRPAGATAAEESLTSGRAAATAEALLALEAGAGPRLALAEYLTRVRSTCISLGAELKTKLAQSAAFVRLSNFQSRLRSFAACKLASGRGVMPPPQEEDSASGLVDELADACRVALVCLFRDVWLALSGHAPQNSEPEMADVEGHIKLSQWLPKSVHNRAHAALEVLLQLRAVDLEEILQHPGCVAEVGKWDMAPGSRLLQPHDAATKGPLSEILAATQGVMPRDARAHPQRQARDARGLSAAGAAAVAAAYRESRPWKSLPEAQSSTNQVVTGVLARSAKHRLVPLTASFSKLPALTASHSSPMLAKLCMDNSMHAFPLVSAVVDRKGHSPLAFPAPPTSPPAAKGGGGSSEVAKEVGKSALIPGISLHRAYSLDKDIEL